MQKMLYKIFMCLSMAHMIMCTTDYCKEELCEYFSESNNTTVVISHIACNNTGEYGPECFEPEMIEMTDDLKDNIIEHHNNLRNKLAAGNVTNLPAACKMPTVVWNDEFAELAELTAKQCDGVTDKCRNTEKFHFVGQNIGQVIITNETDYTFLINFIIDEWFNEYVFATKPDIEKYHTAEPFESYEHFAVMSSDKTTEMGCACIKYQASEKVKNEKSVMLVCNFSYSNFVGQSVYEDGETASKCKTGTNPQFSGLCSKDEEVVAVPDNTV